MKKLLVIALVLVVLVVAVVIYLRYYKLRDFEPQIKERLNKLVMDGSGGLYHLDIEKLEIDVIRSKIVLVNARLRPDTTVYARMEQDRKAPNDLFDVSVKSLSVDDLVPADFMSNRELNLGRLYINNPVVRIWHKKQAYNLPDTDSAKSVYELIANDITSIKCDTIILQNVDFTYVNRNQKDKETRLKNIKISFENILIDSSTQYDRQRFLYARNCLINVKDYAVNTSDSLYRFSVGDLHVETTRRLIRMKAIQFSPRLSVKRYYEHLRHQQDRFELSFEDMSFTEVDWWSLLAEESFLANKITMTNGKVKVFNDKSQPIDPRSKLGKFPHQLLMKLPFNIQLDTLLVQNLDLSYTELNPKSGRSGALYFDNIDGVITNVTNSPEVIRDNPLCRINAKALFMKQAPMTAAFALNLADSKNGSFTVDASMGSLPGETLNSITMPLALLKVNSLRVKRLDASIRGNNYSASGSVKLLYNDLKITALKQADDTLKKRGLLSFIANTFILKKDNPAPNGPTRVHQAVFQRDIHKSFFNLIWKTIFTGAAKTVGYNKK